MKRNTESFRLILDTNVLFSAIRYRGKPFELLEEAERRDVEILIPDYVLDELIEVFERNKIDFTLVRSFLSTYTNITIVEREFSDELIELAKKVVADRKDRPVFIYTLILRKEKPSTYLVTGDKALRDALNKIEENSAITVDGALKLIKRK
ncbi:PIN domain-containing protein [Geoglobus acetivorans]|uniref:PIN domain-containing protein n=1 Tax=Geoglobus acetivorans TaxID=565033 RepID=A0ABZ3H5K6_GEOAI|nr:PIN domain-containing protein [Geoglobus acetivorans]